VWDFTMHGPDGTDYPNWIQWREIVPPERISLIHGSRPDDPDAFESTVSFRAVADVTELTLRSEFKTQARRDEVVEKFGAIEGGEQTLGRLAEYVTEGTQKGRSGRRLITWNLQSLDGYFEGPELWSLDFHLMAWGDELRQFSLAQGREVGVLLFGRTTYEGMAAHWSKSTDEIADFMNSVPKIVFSNTLAEATWNNTRLVRGEAADAVRQLKGERGKDLFIFGSARLCDSLIRQDLIDEYRVCIAPVVLREGTPLFKPGGEMQRLHLLECRGLQTGGVLLRYAPQV
jgi:dihydrofolate reductase